MKNLFKSLILDFQQSLPFPNVRSRDIEIPLIFGKIISMIGPRRSGKTYLFYHLISRLIEIVPAWEYLLSKEV
jgi:predicted AAA+ superfamily ATPase